MRRIKRESFWLHVAPARSRFVFTINCTWTYPSLTPQGSFPLFSSAFQPPAVTICHRWWPPRANMIGCIGRSPHHSERATSWNAETDRLERLNAHRWSANRRLPSSDPCSWYQPNNDWYRLGQRNDVGYRASATKTLLPAEVSL